MGPTISVARLSGEPLRQLHTALNTPLAVDRDAVIRQMLRRGRPEERVVGSHRVTVRRSVDEVVSPDGTERRVVDVHMVAGPAADVVYQLTAEGVGDSDVDIVIRSVTP